MKSLMVGGWDRAAIDGSALKWCSSPPMLLTLDWASEIRIISTHKPLLVPHFSIARSFCQLFSLVYALNITTFKRRRRHFGPHRVQEEIFNPKSVACPHHRRQVSPLTFAVNILCQPENHLLSLPFLLSLLHHIADVRRQARLQL